MSKVARYEVLLAAVVMFCVWQVRLHYVDANEKAVLLEMAKCRAQQEGRVFKPRGRITTTKGEAWD